MSDSFFELGNLNKDTLTIRDGEIAELTYVISPENTKNKTATWKSSNTSIAQVNDGIITAINEGNCVITVSTKNRKTDTSAVQAVAENKWKKGVRVSESRLETDGGPNRG